MAVESMTTIYLTMANGRILPMGSKMADSNTIKPKTTMEPINDNQPDNGHRTDTDDQADNPRLVKYEMDIDHESDSGGQADNTFQVYTKSAATPRHYE